MKLDTRDIFECALIVLLVLAIALVGYNVLANNDTPQTGEGHYEKVALSYTDKIYFVENTNYYQFEFKASADGYVHIQYYESEPSKYVTDMSFHKGKNVIMIPQLDISKKPILTFYERH